MQITVQQAEIKTASVSVKALSINGKQVTLAVFRQLLKEPLIDPASLSLLGKPWGTVNYFWGDCGPTHLHVVWQKGEELRRACVYPNAPNRDALIDDMREDQYLLYLVNLAIEGKLKSAGMTHFCHIVDGMRFEHDVRYTDALFAASWDHSYPRQEINDAVDSLKKQYSIEDADSEGALSDLKHAIAAYRHHLISWKAIYAELEALDQLFIAV